MRRHLLLKFENRSEELQRDQQALHFKLWKQWYSNRCGWLLYGNWLCHAIPFRLRVQWYKDNPTTGTIGIIFFIWALADWECVTTAKMLSFVLFRLHLHCGSSPIWRAVMQQPLLAFILVETDSVRWPAFWLRRLCQPFSHHDAVCSDRARNICNLEESVHWFRLTRNNSLIREISVFAQNDN